MIRILGYFFGVGVALALLAAAGVAIYLADVAKDHPEVIWLAEAFTRPAMMHTLAEVGEHTLHWNCKAKNAVTGAPVSEGRATRVYARINEDGSLKAQLIPADMVNAIRELGDLKHLGPNSGPRR